MISDFVTGLGTALAARGCGSPVVFGLETLASQTDPTLGRVACVLSKDAIGATTRIGGSPRARRTRFATLDVHVWGPVVFDVNGARLATASLAAAEALLHAVINAALDVATGTISFDDVTWDTRTAVARAGYLATFALHVEVPIVDVTYPAPPSGTVAVLRDTFTAPNGDEATTSPSCIG